MHLTGEICGAPVDAPREGRDVLIQVGDETFSPEEIDSLSVSRADWTDAARIGGFVFDHAALLALKQFAAAACLAAGAECGCAPFV